LNLRLSVSPDGRKLALSYIAPSGLLPSEWTNGGYVKTLVGLTAMALVTVVDDLQSGHLTAALNIPWISNVPMWSSDSKSFVMVGMPPVGSDLERQDLNSGRGLPDVQHELWVQPETGVVENVPVPMPILDIQGQPLYWSRQGDLILHTGQSELMTFTHQVQGWERKGQIDLPFKNLFEDAELASDGRFVIGDYQATTVPPQLFQYEIGKQSADVLVRLDPQFDTLTLAPFDRIEWKTSTDYTITGMLFRPPDYVEGKKYPLVIQTKGDAGQFLCDFGQFHFPSFAPQPMANAGMMYLIRTVDKRSWNSVTESNHYPGGYPAGIGEAAFQMDIWDSAVKSLDARGLIDPAKVGLIGFSRAGWYTEFTLAHSPIRYRAATAVDNVQYSLGEYWIWRLPSVVQTYNTLYGGPPSGLTLNNWLKYSISFNLDKINTPLLLEIMGQGVHERPAGAVPLKLAAVSEIFSGLSALKKPVELYYYPDETHSPEHPQARLANLQRNLDWYRFWLQGYERPKPEDPKQYLRWESLRKLELRTDNTLPN
jgi:dipeptidyl aminopeptidase/acylaminoacyl peptidase